MNKIAHFIVHSKAASYIAAILCVVVWVIHAVGRGETINVFGWLGLLLVVVAGYLLVKVGREFSFNDVKNAFPATLFFMSCALAPIAPEKAGVAHMILFPLACYIMLRTYRDRSAMGNYFFAFLLIGIECLLSPPLLLTLPWLVLCGIFMESLHGRTFFAALWGLLLPYWVAFSVLFLTDRVSVVPSYIGQIVPSRSAILPLYDIPHLGIQFAWTLLLVLPACMKVLFDRTLKLQASAGFRLLIASMIVLFVSIGLYSESYSILFPCIQLCASLVGSAFFVCDGNRVKNIYLVVLLILWSVSLGYTYGTIL